MEVREAGEVMRDGTPDMRGERRPSRRNAAVVVADMITRKQNEQLGGLGGKNKPAMPEQ